MGGIESLPEKKLILSFPLCQLPAQVGLIKTYFKVLILKIHKKTASHQNAAIYTKSEVQKVHGSLQGFKKQTEP